EPQLRRGAVLDRADVADLVAGALAVERARRAARIGGGAAVVIPGVDNGASRQRRLGRRRPDVLRERAEQRVGTLHVAGLVEAAIGAAIQVVALRGDRPATILLERVARDDGVLRRRRRARLGDDPGTARRGVAGDSVVEQRELASPDHEDATAVAVREDAALADGVGDDRRVGEPGGPRRADATRALLRGVGGDEAPQHGERAARVVAQAAALVRRRVGRHGHALKRQGAAVAHPAADVGRAVPDRHAGDRGVAARRDVEDAVEPAAVHDRAGRAGADDRDRALDVEVAGRAVLLALP